ncbi:MAG: glycoside hydrolase family 13 protein [Cytophagaceae bacterium]|nr:glycoside hydrolase family 13 protein [Cytophagaceae bacterium]
MKRIILILLTLSLNTFAQEIQHFEPSSWWIGMKNPKLQVLIHGKDISTFSLNVNYPGVKLVKINKTENPNYLFVDLVISTSAKAGKVPFRFSKGNQKTDYFLDLINRKPNSAKREGYSTKDVMYLITPDRFANGNVANDNIADYPDALNRARDYGRHGGDIEGIKNNLDYISEMGFTTIWPMPLEENKMKEASYHGYAITDFYKIDPRYGTNEEYLNLVKEAKKRNLKFIRDVVLNHCGLNHWWMHDLPSKDWINNEGKFTPTNHQRETMHDPYVAQADLDKMTQGWFVTAMPDMNQRNPFMANYLIQNTIWWIEYADLDGLRIDTYPYSDKTFLSNWSKAVMDEYPKLNMVGEEWSTRQAVTAYWQMGQKNKDGYRSFLPSMMDFPLNNALIEGLKENDKDWGKGMLKVYQCLSDDYLYADANKLVTFCDNHDMNRIYTQLAEDKELLKMGLALVFTTRGIPQLFYGTELAFTSPLERNDGLIRADMPGGWEGDKSNVFKNENLTPLQSEMRAFVKQLLNWRKTATAIHDGKLLHFAPHEGIYTYFRYNAKEKFWIIFNKYDKEKTMNFADYKEIIPVNATFEDVFTTKTESIVTVPAKGFRILKVK